MKNVHVLLILNELLEHDGSDYAQLLGYIIGGRFNDVLALPLLKALVVDNVKMKQIIESGTFDNVNQFLGTLVGEIKNALLEQFTDSETVSMHLLIFAIILLQSFIQLNFTGPSIELQIGLLQSLNQYNREFITSLASLGQLAYDLTDSPYLLALSIKILESLNESPISVLDQSMKIDDTEAVVMNSNVQTTLDPKADYFLASVQWWRSRAYQVQISLLPDASSILASLSALLLNNSVLLTLSSELSPEAIKKLLIIYHLETARNGLSTNTEHISITALARARKVSGLSLVLTGCRAKRTKFQQTAFAGLIVLAKNDTFALSEDTNQEPEHFKLESDVLLERPVYESVGDEVDTLQEENDSKRIKLDYSNSPIDTTEDQNSKLLPIALREEFIPQELKDLDPNNQPRLSDLDLLQLFLRFVTLKQTSPSGSPLVEEELMALVQRILFSPENSVNWTLYSKSLWERSLLETSKAKTVERGVLQMQSLVEELGMSSLKTRLFAQGETETNSDILPSSKRLRLIHQLPLVPRWSMDASLAEKFMSLGVLRSAIEIYERLEMWNEAALCYAAVGSEKEALEILEKRLAQSPNDARTLSIMGDIKQDPSYWIKSWEIGRYAKAKNSLAKYYYSPPKSSGLSRDLAKAIENQYDALTINPLSYDSWYFYGCLGLEAANYKLAAELFTRCVSIDDTNAHAWSNLSSALVSLDKLKPAFNALQKAVRVGNEMKSWRIWENYLIVAAKLRQWEDVLVASRQLLKITKDSNGENAIDIPIVEKLVEILLSTDYDEDNLSYFQKSCIEYICVLIPGVINTSARCWRIISRVEFWRKRPWATLDCLEKLFRAMLNNPELEINESVWSEAVESCSDLVAGYENYGELQGRHGSGDLVCKDWKYKAKTSVRSLLSRGRSTWEGTDSYDRLLSLKEELMN